MVEYNVIVIWKVYNNVYYIIMYMGFAWTPITDRIHAGIHVYIFTAVDSNRVREGIITNKR